MTNEPKHPMVEHMEQVHANHAGGIVGEEKKPVTTEHSKERFRHMKRLYNHRFTAKLPAGWVKDDSGAEHAVYDLPVLKEIERSLSRIVIVVKGTEAEIHFLDEQVEDLKAADLGVDFVRRAISVREADHLETAPLTGALPEGFNYPTQGEIEAVQAQQREEDKAKRADVERRKAQAVPEYVHLSKGMQHALMELILEADSAPPGSVGEKLAKDAIVSIVRILVVKGA